MKNNLIWYAIIVGLLFFVGFTCGLLTSGNIYVDQIRQYAIDKNFAHYDTQTGKLIIEDEATRKLLNLE